MSREKIKKAALALFERYSYAKTSVDDIAKTAGIGKGSIYLSFKTKEDVLLALLNDEIVTIRQEHETIFLDPKVPIDEKLELFVNDLFAIQYKIRDLMFGSIENITGKELQSVFKLFSGYIADTVEFWIHIMEIHGYAATQMLREDVKELVFLLTGKFVLVTLAEGWGGSKELHTEMPLLAKRLFRALIPL